MNEQETSGGVPAPPRHGQDLYDGLLARMAELLEEIRRLFESAGDEWENGHACDRIEDEAARMLPRLPCPLHHTEAAHAIGSLLFGKGLVPAPERPEPDSGVAFQIARVYLHASAPPRKVNPGHYLLLLAATVAAQENAQSIDREKAEEKAQKQTKHRIYAALARMTPEARAALLAQVEGQAGPPGGGG